MSTITSPKLPAPTKTKSPKIGPGPVSQIAARRADADSCRGLGATTTSIDGEIRRGGATPPTTESRKDRPRRFVRPGLTPFEEHRLRHQLRKSAPSEPWVDAQIKTFQDHSAYGKEIVCRFHDAQVFPPGGKSQTPMRYCRHCGRFTPPNCINLIEHRRTHSAPITSSSLQCDDCRIAADHDRYKELYDAGLYLKPPSSTSFVRMADLHNLKNRK